MPCDSSYMEPNNLEVEISKVACLLDELAGIKSQPAAWKGYHPRVYTRCNRELADALVAELCAALRERDVTQYSLEMQIWWRDHQAADQEKEKIVAKAIIDMPTANSSLGPSLVMVPMMVYGAFVDNKLVGCYAMDDNKVPGRLLWSADQQPSPKAEGLDP